MKELLGHSSNLILAPDLTKPTRLRASVELIVICSEPTYSYGLEGLTRSRTVTEMRVLCGHKALRDTARQLIELADEAESLEKAMNDARAPAPESTP